MFRKKSSKFKFLNNLLFLLLFVLILPAQALPTDKNQPVHISADKGHINKMTGVSIFQGNVVMTQGSSTLITNLLTIYSDKNNQLIKAVAEGPTTTYSTLTDVNKPPFIATADTIQYLPPQSQIILIGNAKAVQGPNSYTAPTIQYHIDQEMVISPASQLGRTTIVIQPQFFQHSQSPQPPQPAKSPS
jgi:lipopolysaccharide export system protein LptA